MRVYVLQRLPSDSHFPRAHENRQQDALSSRTPLGQQVEQAGRNSGRKGRDRVSPAYIHAGAIEELGHRCGVGYRTQLRLPFLGQPRSIEAASKPSLCPHRIYMSRPCPQPTHCYRSLHRTVLAVFKTPGLRLMGERETSLIPETDGHLPTMWPAGRTVHSTLTATSAPINSDFAHPR